MSTLRHHGYNHSYGAVIGAILVCCVIAILLGARKDK